MEEDCALDIKKYVGHSAAILPAGVVLGGQSLRDLRAQKDAVIPEGTKKIGKMWFKYSKVESVTIPASVQEIAPDAFADCDDIKRICVAEGCEASLSGVDLSYSATVDLASDTMVGDVKVRDLRDCKEAVIPEGVARIGNHWFWESEVESVTIPASVREIGADAFCNCRSL